MSRPQHFLLRREPVPSDVDLRAVTVADVRAALVELATYADDDEVAHGAEDCLRHRVLVAVALGCAAPDQVANVALESGLIDFARWCA